MALNPGDRLGPYVITGLLGRGGMGEVFKAEDTRLHRFVAIKLIGRHVREQEDSRRRLMVEAQAIAALNHEHIRALHDTGHQDGLDFLVLEYLEGETLAERLLNGPVTFPDLVGWAIEIAEALEYAHARNILHRDLKPSNVFITRTHGAKLMDFGLAAMKGATTNDLAQLGTEPVRLTAEGTLVGTLPYFAPERLKGADADARSDIFSYGAILYEMLTGKPAFEEKTQAELIAAILTQEPAWSPRDGADVGELRFLIRGCLAKEPQERWQSMADAVIVLRSVASALKTTREPSVGQRRRSIFQPVAIALALAIIGMIAFSLARLKEPVSPRPVSFTIGPPGRTTLGLTDSTVRSAQFAVAPDGHAVVFVVSAEGRDQLWIRQVDQLEPRPLENTSGASYPFWSPDSRQIGFFAELRLKRIAESGGPARLICDATNGRGGTWNAAGEIVFVPDNTSPLHRVPAGGGTPRPLAPLPTQQNSQRWPQFLPDGDHLLYFGKSESAQSVGVYVTSLSEPGKNILLRRTATNGLYASGHLLYVLEGALVAQPFNPETLALTGDGAALPLNVGGSSTYYSAFSASDNGMLVTWSADASSELAWFSRTGVRLSTVAPRGRYIDFRLSPDERRLAFARIDDHRDFPDIWVLDVERGINTKVTTAPQTDASPVWAPDGRHLVFRSNRRSLHELFEVSVFGSADEQRLFGSGGGTYPTDWPTNDVIVYHERQGPTAYDIYRLNVTQGAAKVLVGSADEEVQGQIGKDGRIAFASNRSGQFDVYVSAPDNAKSVQRVSANGGSDPRWRSDGRELFFVATDGTLMAVDTTLPAPPAATPLFKTQLPPANSPYPSGMLPSRDGQRFLLKVPVDLPETKPLAVITDWTRRVSSGR